jgi:hypothetical protein
MAHFGDLLDESRETLLELTADAIATFARQRKRDRDETEPAEPAPGEGDFLQDVLTLNLQYLNQLARLGSSYSIVAGRLLERVYDRVVREGEASVESISNRVEGPAGRTLRARVAAANPERRRLGFRASVAAFRAVGDRKAHELELRLCSPPSPAATSTSSARSLDGAEFSVGPKGHVELELELELPRALKAGTQYRGEVVLEAEDGSLRIVRPLFVCRTATP